MIKRIVSLLFACTILAAPSYAEEVYKRVDESGVPSFSDTHSENAEKIIVEPANVQKIPTPTAQPPLYSTPSSTANSIKYSTLEISSPADQSTLRNEPTITVTATVKPGLHADHNIEFLDNGQPLQVASKKTAITLANFDRGSHNLSVRILNKNGKVLQSSNTITVYVFRNVIKPPPAPAK